MTFHSFFQDQDQILYGGMKVMKDTTVSGEEVAIILKTSTSSNFVTLPKLTYHLKMNPWKMRFLLETIHIQVRAVSFREGIFFVPILHWIMVTSQEPEAKCKVFLRFYGYG